MVDEPLSNLTLSLAWVLAESPGLVSLCEIQARTGWIELPVHFARLQVWLWIYFVEDLVRVLQR
jgi:hypothetical protein